MTSTQEDIDKDIQLTQAKGLQVTLFRFKYVLRCWLNTFPTLYILLARFSKANKEGHAAIVDQQTDLMIEAFPGSGNTFAVLALTKSQSKPLKIAHHLHAAAHVIKAVRLKVPVIIILREPESASLSALIRSPLNSLSNLLKEYVTFHKRILPYRNEILIVKFETLTNNFVAVVDAFNAKYHTEYESFLTEKTMADDIFITIDSKYRVNSRTNSPAPSTDRSKQKDALKSLLNQSELADCRRAARQMYDELHKQADV